jgi:hypothetical protein
MTAQLFSRRRFLRRAGSVAAAGVAGGVFLSDAYSAGTSTASAGPIGTVVDVSPRQIQVQWDDGTRTSGNPPPIERHLRAGDRVVIEAGVVSPLFRTVSGVLQKQGDQRITVSGRDFAVDATSDLFDTRQTQRTKIGRVNTTTLEAGTNVGMLCIQNPADSLLPVAALFILD